MSAEFWNVEDRVGIGAGPAVRGPGSRGDFGKGTGSNRRNLRDEHRDTGAAEAPRTAVVAGIGRGTAGFLGAAVWRDDGKQIGRLDSESREPDSEEDPGHAARYHVGRSGEVLSGDALLDAVSDLVADFAVRPRSVGEATPRGSAHASDLTHDGVFVG
jgi:hypothetical protein